MANKTDNEIVNKISKALEERNAYKKLLEDLAKKAKSEWGSPVLADNIKEQLKEIKARK